MSSSYIPPFPSGNGAEDTPYTQVFNKARDQRKTSGAQESVFANPKTPPNTRHREPDPPRFIASPLHPNNLSGGRSPLHQQGSSGNGSRGSNRSGSSHKPVNPNYSSFPSPIPSKSNGSGRSQEGQIGNSTPARNTPTRKKKVVEQDYNDLLPPFPSEGADGGNYTEVFAKYKKGSTSPTAQPVPTFTPRRDESPKMQRCSCFGL